MQNILKIENLCKAYPSFSLKNVSFSLPQGSIMGFVGENGAGKTTVIKAALNLISRQSGNIEILGMDINTQEKAIKEQIGVVFDENNFADTLTPAYIGNIFKNIYKNWDMPVYENYLRRFNLQRGKTVKELSKGMKMKLCIATALSHHPRLLILDEATSGLDPIVRDEILDIFLEFIQDEKRSILFSSHITSDLDKIADYITCIHQGEILFSENKDVLLYHMGVAKCSQQQLKQISPYVLRVRQGQFGCQALVKDRQALLREQPDIIVDPASIEEIMLFYAKGQKV